MIGSLPSGLTMQSGAMKRHPKVILDPSGDHVGFSAREGEGKSTTRRVVPSGARTAQRPVAHGYAISVLLGDHENAGFAAGAPALLERTSLSPVPSARTTQITHGSGAVLYASHLLSADHTGPIATGVSMLLGPIRLD